MSRTPRLFVVSGPSGAGKGTLVSLVREQRPDLGLTVSATTRQPRPGEVDGVSYHFLSKEEFATRVEAGEFLEWANVHGNCYGTLRSEVDPDAVLVFIEPPSMEVLEQRLRGRGTEDEQSLELRLADAAGEMEMAREYDERVVNDDLQESCAELLRVLDSHEMN